MIDFFIKRCYNNKNQRRKYILIRPPNDLGRRAKKLCEFWNEKPTGMALMKAIRTVLTAEKLPTWEPEY
jgi:hypothetical protein